VNRGFFREDTVHWKHRLPGKKMSRQLVSKAGVSYSRIGAKRLTGEAFI
jgi:hypothetical protein